MAGRGEEVCGTDGSGSLPVEVQLAEAAAQGNRGGWITIPFIIGNMLLTGLAMFGAYSNLVVYLIQRFNVKSIDAAQINNIVNGCSSLTPVVGAIIADSYFGCFSIIAISTFISFLGVILITLTAMIHSLRPSSCTDTSQTCEVATRTHFTVLYAGITLVAVGIGGTRFTTATMGASQFHNSKDQDTFFNWYFFTMYVSAVAANIGVVYIQDNVGWGLGFALCAAANAVGLAIFVLGRRYYLRNMPEGSPFVGLARVVVASVRKRMKGLSTNDKDYYYGDHCSLGKLASMAPPSQSFSFFNRAALKSEGDTHSDDTIAKPWRLCTVEQVEDLKTVIRILPVWSTTIFISVPIGIQISLTILQALSMDRHVGPHFSIPAASFLVSVQLSTSIFLPLVDRVIFPWWRRIRGGYPTSLQRVGIGHVLNILGIAMSAVVESRRLHVVKAHNLADHPTARAPMSALWLVFPLALVGAGEAFHFPGGVAFYYQEFPASLRSTSTAMSALIIAMGFYLSTAVVDLIRRVTSWLPDNINQARIDNVYWTMAAVGFVNFGYFQLCANLYKYKNVRKEEKIPIST